MGSVIDYIECPNCGHEAHSDFYYKTGEEFINCNNCGFYRYIELDSDVADITNLKDSDYNITECADPYGAYRLQYKGQPGRLCGTLETKQQYDDLRERVKDDTDVEFVSVSRLVNGSIEEEMLVDNT